MTKSDQNNKSAIEQLKGLPDCLNNGASAIGEMNMLGKAILELEERLIALKSYSYANIELIIWEDENKNICFNSVAQMTNFITSLKAAIDQLRQTKDAENK